MLWWQFVHPSSMTLLLTAGGPEYARQVGIRSLEPVGVFLPGTQSYPGGEASIVKSISH